MKKILISALILSSVLLTSCWNESVVRIENQDIKNERLQAAKTEYSNFKINWKKDWKIDVKWNGRELNFKWFSCENIIPFYEYKINLYNNTIWYYDEFWSKYQDDKWIYDGTLLKYNYYIRLLSQGKDDNWICIYWASLLNWKWEEKEKTDKIFAIYKEGIFEYKNMELFDRLEAKKVSSTSFWWRNNERIDDNDYGSFENQYSLDKSSISWYLDYLLGVITFISNENFEKNSKAFTELKWYEIPTAFIFNENDKKEREDELKELFDKEVLNKAKKIKLDKEFYENNNNFKVDLHKINTKWIIN